MKTIIIFAFIILILAVVYTEGIYTDLAKQMIELDSKNYKQEAEIENLQRMLKACQESK